MYFKVPHNVKFQHNKVDFCTRLLRSRECRIYLRSYVERFARSYENSKFELGCDVHCVYKTTKECEVSNYKEQHFLSE